MGLWDTISSAASSATSAVTSTVSKAVSATTSAASSAASTATHAVSSTVDTIEKAAPKAAVSLGTVAKSGLDEAEKLAKQANSAAASFSKENDPFNFGEQFDQYKKNPLGKLLSNLNPLNPVKEAAAIGYDTVSSAVGDVKNIAKNPQSASDVLQAFNPLSQGAALVEGAAAAVSPPAKQWLEKTANGSSPLKELPGLGDFRIASNPKAALASGLSELDLGLDVASVTGIGEAAKGGELALRGGAEALLDQGAKDAEKSAAGSALSHADPGAGGLKRPTIEEPPSEPDVPEDPAESLPPPRVQKLDTLQDARNIRKLEPNTIYEVPANSGEEGYPARTFRTDDLGRPVESSGQLSTPIKGLRSSQDAKIGKTGDPGDIGFHLGADRFGFPGGKLNIVPGAERLNKASGEWGQVEQHLADLQKAGHTVDAKFSAIYNEGNTGVRPDKFMLEYSVDGGPPTFDTFYNK